MDNWKSMKIGFIGAGCMAHAICDGMTRTSLLEYSQIYASAPDQPTLESWKRLGVHTYTDNAPIVEESDIIFLSVKPQTLDAAITGVCSTLKNPNKVANKLFISILAGIKLDCLEHVLAKFEGYRVIRVMPNTPIRVGAGCTVYCPGHNATEGDIKRVEQIFSISGICTLVPEEMMNAVGALAGSGPAYIFLVIEALSDGGVKMGLSRQMSTKFAAQMVLGSAKMILDTGKHPGMLKDEVCSPGGTTIIGIHELEKSGVRAAFMNAIEAATQNSIHLGNNHN